VNTLDFEIAKIGERGQVVIPQSFRNDMSIHKGDKFMVLQRGDMLVLKKLVGPSVEDFTTMLKKSHAHAKKHKFSEQDLEEAIQKARKQ